MHGTSREAGIAGSFIAGLDTAIRGSKRIITGLMDTRLAPAHHGREAGVTP
jgi:hypothetical protein